MGQANRASWNSARSSLEHWVEGVLSRLPEAPPAKARVVVLGGGTGLSTVLGGNSARPLAVRCAGESGRCRAVRHSGAPPLRGGYAEREPE